MLPRRTTWHRPRMTRRRLWQSAISGKPLRVLRRQTMDQPPSDPATKPDAAAKLLAVESLDATYYFDRVVVSKNSDSGAVTLSKRQRLLPYSFDMAQLPFLL